MPDVGVDRPGPFLGLVLVPVLVNSVDPDIRGDLYAHSVCLHHLTCLLYTTLLHHDSYQAELLHCDLSWNFLVDRLCITTPAGHRDDFPPTFLPLRLRFTTRVFFSPPSVNNIV